MLGTRTVGNAARPMIHQRIVRAASPARAADEATVASAFASDVRAVLDATRPFETTLAMLGEFAIVKLDVALREAAGRPHDSLWRAAFDALDEFVSRHLRQSRYADESRSFVRLTDFLAENADLDEAPVGAAGREVSD